MRAKISEIRRMLANARDCREDEPVERQCLKQRLARLRSCTLLNRRAAGKV